MKKILLLPNEILAYGRAFACLSAAGYSAHNMPPLQPIMRMLSQRMYIPLDYDFTNLCRPYLSAVRTDGTQVVYMPAWARAGVRYARIGIDIRQLDPADWYHEWWDLYREVLGILEDADPNAHERFGQMFDSLPVAQEAIRTLIDQKRLITDRTQIQKLTTAGV